jgi:nitrite reductase (NO-forming)
MVLKQSTHRWKWMGYAMVLGLLSAGNAQAEMAQLTTAPNVPAPIKRTAPAKVVIKFEAKEYVSELADGKKYKFWSFNGTVPGPMARVRVGDTVEFHLSNHKDSEFPHNIDIHAVNGPGGGAAVNLVGAGDTAVFQFKALNPGLYIYHCASPIPNIPAHIANGMYGLILVEPEKGLAKVDHEFYVFESEFFTQPSGKKGVSELSMEKGLAEHPDHVFFNGKAGALTGDNVLKAKAGDTVRVYFGNIGPNGISSFHIIGEIFDKVYMEGALSGAVNHNVQTTLVPSAGATIVEFKIDVPGDYLLVDHSIFRVAK